LHPPGVSRPGGSPAAGSSGHAMVWSWYGWPLEFKGRAPHGKVTAGLERVTAGHGGARRGGVTAVTVLGGASPPGGGHVRILFAASAARASDRWICSYQCLRLNGLLPLRCPPPPTWDLGACAEERARYLLGGPPTEPVDNRWGVRVAARGAGWGEGRGGRDRWRYAARAGGTRRRLRRGGPRG